MSHIVKLRKRRNLIGYMENDGRYIPQEAPRDIVHESLRISGKDEHSTG